MIYIIIVILLITLVFLFTDWSNLTRRWRSALKGRRPSAKVSANAGIEPSATSFDPSFEDEEPSPQGTYNDSEPANRGHRVSDELEKLLSEADIHFRKGELKAAENVYVQVAAKDPLCSKAYSRLGVIYLEQGENYSDAEDAFRQALKSDASNGFVLNNLGLVLYYQDKFADAIRNFEQAVRQDEFNAARHANLGMAYMAMRQYAKAESSFKKALKLAPGEMEYKDLLNESIEKKNAHKTMIRR
jgi:Tfp pilus assembly protein PilF